MYKIGKVFVEPIEDKNSLLGIKKYDIHVVEEVENVEKDEHYMNKYTMDIYKNMHGKLGSVLGDDTYIKDRFYKVLASTDLDLNVLGIETTFIATVLKNSEKDTFKVAIKYLDDTFIDRNWNNEINPILVPDNFDAKFVKSIIEFASFSGKADYTNEEIFEELIKERIWEQ